MTVFFICGKRYRDGNFSKYLLLDYLPHFHCSVVGYSYKIKPAGQGSDIDGGGWFGDFLLQELLTAEVQDGDLTCGGGFDSDVSGCGVGGRSNSTKRIKGRNNEIA